MQAHTNDGEDNNLHPSFFSHLILRDVLVASWSDGRLFDGSQLKVKLFTLLFLSREDISELIANSAIGVPQVEHGSLLGSGGKHLSHGAP